jgi:high-affinity iron transporter
MVGTTIIVFREVLEAALIVSIVMAAAKGVARRNFWVGSGVIAGIFGAGLVAAFASSIATAAAGIGQELLNAAILFLAVVMLGWHNVWMSRHGRELAQQVGAVGRAVIAGARPLYALAVVTGVAVLREGSETVLFVYGIAAGGGDAAGMLFAGAVIGLAGGSAIGILLYVGLLRIPLRHLFSVTNWMILLLAAGMAAQGAGFLVQADLLPPLGDALWDTSAVLSEHSVLGKVLHTLVGYVAQPAGIQLIFYAATLLVIGALMRLLGAGTSPRRRGPGQTMSGAAAVALAAGLAALATTSTARAEFKLRYPIVDYREVEVEHNGATTFDKRKSGLSNNQSYTNEIGYGIFPFWSIEIEGEWAAPSGQNLRYDATTLENTFQFTPQGKYWADVGFFAEYSHAASRASADSVTFGPLVQKEVPDVWGTDTVHTLNVLFGKEIGHNRVDDTSLSLNWQSRLRLDPLFEPGIELYNQIASIETPGKFAEQQHRIGPVVVGLYNMRGYGKIKYEVGYQFGMTRATEQGAVRWRLEFERAF